MHDARQSFAIGTPVLHVFGIHGHARQPVAALTCSLGRHKRTRSSRRHRTRSAGIFERARNQRREFRERVFRIQAGRI